ncbi:MAG: DUF4112 domain-containing protein [Longimicrobiales bacterium]
MKKTGNDIATNRSDTVHRLAWILDEAIRIPGTNRRVGLDAVLGLLPGGGDLLGGAISAYTIVLAHRNGAGPAIIMRMFSNILIDMVVGAVPLVGDLFDAGWKSNSRNVTLLDKFNNTPAAARKSSLAVVVLALAGIVALLAATAVLSVRLTRWLVMQF